MCSKKHDNGDYPETIELSEDELLSTILQYQEISRAYDAAVSQPLAAIDTEQVKSKRKLEREKKALGVVLVSALIKWFRKIVNDVTDYPCDKKANPYLQEVITAFFENLPKFDPEVSNIFAYMYARLKGAVFVEYAKANNFSKSQTRYYKKTIDAEIELTQKLQRVPADKELAQFLGISVKELAGRRHSPQMVSMDEPDEDEGGNEKKLEVADEDANVETAVLRIMEDERFDELVKNIPLREQVILITMKSRYHLAPKAYSQEAALQEAASALQMSREETVACMKHGLHVLFNEMHNE